MRSHTVPCTLHLALVVLGALAAPLAAHAATLNVLQTEAPRSMDPGDQTASFTAAVLDPMYEGLVRRNDKLELEPALATSWSSDPTGLIWTFKLRPGVVFHDGARFDADAVVANIQRHLDTKRGLAASGRLRPVIAGVTAIDPMTVEFKLKAPYPAFLALLTTGPGLMVSPKGDAAGTIGRIADGTGPYKLAEYKSGEYVLEQKFPGYWGKPGGSDAIKWTWSAEPSILNMAVQSGDADVVNPLPPAFAKTVAANPALKLSQTDGSAVFWVALNTKMKPLDDVRVRQALNYATDRKGLVQVIMNGYARPANSPLAAVTPGYDASLDPYPTSIDKAKALLKEAGVADGFAMSVAVQEPEARIAEVLQGMWAKIGVKLEVRKMEGGVWTKASFADPAGKAADGLGATLASWSSGVNGADLQLRPLYDTASWAPGGANLGFFSDPKLDALIDKAASTLDVPARNAIYVDAQKLVNADAPHVLLYYKNDLFATRADVSGVWVVPGGQIMVRDAVKK